MGLTFIIISFHIWVISSFAWLGFEWGGNKGQPHTLGMPHTHGLYNYITQGESYMNWINELISGH